MLRHKLRILLIIIVGTVIAGISHFLIFIYYYKNMSAEHLTEYWRAVHGGRMLNEVLPAHLIAALVSVGIVVFATCRRVAPADQGKRPDQRDNV